MRYIFTVVAILLSFSLRAEVFRIGGADFDFEEKEILLHGCQKDCLAQKALKTHKSIDLKKVRSQLTFVGSVGSDVCKHIYQAKSVIGTNMAKDQRAFCVFPDESMIEINSLSDYLEKKKIIK